MNPETQQLKFTCYKCSAENKYPVADSNDFEGANNIIKRCINCSAENKVELPEGWVALRNEVLFRGKKTD